MTNNSTGKVPAVMLITAHYTHTYLYFVFLHKTGLIDYFYLYRRANSPDYYSIGGIHMIPILPKRMRPAQYAPVRQAPVQFLVNGGAFLMPGNARR